MRILLVNGNTSAAITERIASEARRVESSGTEINAVTADFGARLIISRTDSAIAAHAVISAIAQHCANADAAVIAVSTDTGLHAARELAPIPVVGMTEASLLTACMLGGRFGLIVFDQRALPVFRELVAMHGQSGRMAGALAVDMTADDFMHPDRVQEATLRAIERLVNESGAESIVVTGATTSGIARSLQAQSPVPLLDGISCAVLQAELLARLGLPKPRTGSYVAHATREQVGIDPALARSSHRVRRRTTARRQHKSPEVTMASAGYPRDMIGYGAHPPDPKWPGGARVALQFVLNVEEGGENCILHGDAASESFISDIPGAQPLPGVRHINMESLYEYGSRAGFWRVLRLFAARKLPLTAFAVGMALERNPDAAVALAGAGHEIATHGWRWINYQYVDEHTERSHIREAIASIERLTGARPLGWYQGRVSPQTRRLVVEEGGFVYDADAYNDDLPYWLTVSGKPLLIVPYTLDANDARFTSAPGFSSGDDFFAYLRDSFDALYTEGADAPKMMSVGLHSRVVGRPGRIASLARFMDHVARHDKVWVCRRIDIANHWIRHHPYDRASAFDADMGTRP